LAELFVAPEDLMAPSSSSAPLIGKLLSGEMERFRESVDSVIGSLSLVHLSYWHIRLLMKRHTPGSEPTDLLGPAQIMASILNNTTTPITPLTHHFASLTALTLVELAELPDVKDGAWQGIKELQEALEKRRGGLSTRSEDAAGSWVAAIRDLLTTKAQQPRSGGGSVPNQGSLQHLADLAVGESENGAPGLPAQGNAEKHSEGPEFTALTKMGYLTALVQENGR